MLSQETSTEVKLTPPIISAETILQRITCTRPTREGEFNISTEIRQEKKIINCYGHGGAGWTTLFGSVNEAIQLFQRDFAASKQLPIRVVGAGCVGLTAAIELKRLGYNVVGIVADEIYDTASWRAGGYFAFVSVKTSPEEQEHLNVIGEETFKVYECIGQGKHAYLSKETVRYLPVYCGKDTEAGIKDLAARKLLPPPEEVTLDFGKGVKHPNFLKYMTYYMDTTHLMQQLMAEVIRLGIPLTNEHIGSFDEIAETCIFNCTGLGGKELNCDAKIIPVRGHLLLLNTQAGNGHLDYMIYHSLLQDGKEEYIYMFPKELAVSSEHQSGLPCRGVLGGTFIPNTEALTSVELAELDARAFKKMLERHQQFFRGIA